MSKLAVLSTIFIILQVSLAEEKPQIGRTKTGKPCLRERYWGRRYSDVSEIMKEVDEFVARQQNKQESEKRPYECYLDVDTEEYELVSFKRTHSDSSIFSEEIVFKTRTSNLQTRECGILTYSTNCDEIRNMCATRKSCQPNNPARPHNEQVLVAIAACLLFLTFIGIIAVSMTRVVAYIMMPNNSTKIADNITLKNISDYCTQHDNKYQ